MKNFFAIKTKGFTLLEFLLYFGILAILIVTVLQILFQITEARIKSETIQEVTQNARIINESISDFVRNAQSVTSPTIGATGQSLTLVMSDAAKNPSVFSLDSGVLSLQKAGGVVMPLHTNEVTISSLSFTNVSYPSSPGAIRVVFTLQASAPAGARIYHHTETFYTTITIRPQ